MRIPISSSARLKKKSASSNSTLCPPVPPWRPFMCSIHHLPIDFLKVYHSLLVDVLPLHSKVPMRKKMTDHSCTKPDALRCTYPWGFCHLFPSHWQEWLPVLWDVVNLTWPQPNSCPWHSSFSLPYCFPVDPAEWQYRRLVVSSSLLHQRSLGFHMLLDKKANLLAGIIE